MKTNFKKILFFLIITQGIAIAQKKYQPNWKSLSARPIPEWFENAKFGIFIHWGPYSVPAWSPKGTYAEWYQYWLENKTLWGNGQFKGDEVVAFHGKTYGKHFDYYEFGDMFTADLFKPKNWAELFEKAGAKYIVLTSKHHDGFALWPSEQANDRGFAWNSMEVGAYRDLVGELMQEVKKTSVKMGLYYSLYEWYHPWWLKDKPRFVEEHFLPQIKDLINRYEPDILWADGEWEMSSEEWKTAPLIAWLFNESKIKEKVVINDRWGKETRKKYGGYLTTEYEITPFELSKIWEECRGMGFSFGYNRNEDIEDYSSPQSLVLNLVNIVSNGGNLLLDIGPDSRGRIPVIMQERLLQIGQWLDVNGQAIYNTKPWNHSVQWSLEGKRDYKPSEHYASSEFILKQTLYPAKGNAVKELFFTQNKEAYFVFVPRWLPVVEIRNFIPEKNAEMTLLSNGSELIWLVEGDHTYVQMPAYHLAKRRVADDYCYVIKIKK